MCLLCESTWDGQHRIGCWYWLYSVDSNQLIRSTASFSSQVLSYSVLRCQQGYETLPKSSPQLALMKHLGGEAYWCCEVNWRKVTLNQEVSSLLSSLPSHLLPPLSPPSPLPSLSSLPLLFDYIPTEQLERLKLGGTSSIEREGLNRSLGMGTPCWLLTFSSATNSTNKATSFEYFIVMILGSHCQAG